MGDDRIQDADEERYFDDQAIPGRDPLPECDTPLNTSKNFAHGQTDERGLLYLKKVERPQKYGGGETNYDTPISVWGFLALFFMFAMLYEVARGWRVKVCKRHRVKYVKGELVDVDDE